MSFTSNAYEEYTLRLHNKRDLDLLTLYMNDKNFKRKVINLLSDYANGVIPNYSLDNVNIDLKSATDSNSVTYKSQYMRLFVNKKSYPEVISLLSKIRRKYKCDFIKCIVKNSLKIPISSLYFTEVEDGMELNENLGKLLANDSEIDTKIVKARKGTPKKEKSKIEPILSIKQEDLIKDDMDKTDNTSIESYEEEPDDAYDDMLNQLITDY